MARRTKDITEKFICTVCGKEYNKKGWLDHHLKTAHPIVKARDNGDNLEQEVATARSRDIRCRPCGRLLFRAYLIKGSKIRIRCPRCGRFTTVIAY